MLEENRKRYIKAGNLIKAENAYKKIIHLKSVENEKIEEDLKQSFFLNKSHIEDDQTLEINNDKEDFENKIIKVNEKYKELQSKLHEKNKKELTEFIQNFEKKYPKPFNIYVKEIDSLKKALNSHIKEKKYYNF